MMSNPTNQGGPTPFDASLSFQSKPRKRRQFQSIDLTAAINKSISPSVQIASPIGNLSKVPSKKTIF